MEFVVGTAAQKKLEEFLEEFDLYVAAGGDPAVPQQALGRPYVDKTGQTKEYPLGRRAQYMRARHAQNALPAEHVQMLEEKDGWVWDLADARWHQQYREVLDHLEEHGGYEGIDPAAGMWLTRARQALNAGKLPADKGALIRALPQRAGVDRFCSAALTWLAAHPRSTLRDVPAGTVVDLDGKPYNLAKTIWYYQRRGAGLEGTHPLSDEDRQALQALPGWQWTTENTARA